MSSLERAIHYAHKHRKGPSIKGELTPEMEAWIAELGQEYKPAKLPAGIERGPVGDCFDVCLVNIVFSTKWQYVEGKAFDGIKWYYHGWLTDGVHAFDPTWQVIGKDGPENPLSPLRYIGIPLPNAFVMMFVSKTQYNGILGNRARYPSAVDKILEYRKKELEASK